MKKKFIYVGVLCLWATKSLAQLNVQLHYDLGHGMYGNEISSRQHLTATVENFSADKWGSTYFFMDADFGDNVLRGAYGEFSREIQTKKMPVAFHVEYNGGLSYGTGKGDGYAFGDAYLTGVAYNWNSKDFAKGFSVQAMYKYLAKNGPYCHSWQLTGVWRNRFAGGLCTFSGFVDLPRTRMARLCPERAWLQPHNRIFVKANIRIEHGNMVNKRIYADGHNPKLKRECFLADRA